MQKHSAILLLASLLTLATPLLAQTKASGPTGKRDLISRADTNSDGTVSREEFLAYERTRAEQMFDKLDTNKDGTIQPTELRQKKKRTQKSAQ